MLHSMVPPGVKKTKVLQQSRKTPVARWGKDTNCRVLFDASPLLSSLALFRIGECSLIPKIRPCRSCSIKSWAILLMWKGCAATEICSGSKDVVAIAFRGHAVCCWVLSLYRAFFVSPVSLPPACIPLMWWCQCYHREFLGFSSSLQWAVSRTASFLCV